MKLHPEYFNEIKSGERDLEYRLNDEKRRKLELGDVIIFKNSKNLEDTFEVRVVGLLKYENFFDMFDDLYERHFKGKYNNMYKSSEEVAESMKEIYKEEDILKYGGLAIKFKLI
jgi:ASC-1-like (ASCH) protein